MVPINPSTFMPNLTEYCLILYNTVLWIRIRSHPESFVSDPDPARMKEQIHLNFISNFRPEDSGLCTTLGLYCEIENGKKLVDSSF